MALLHKVSLHICHQVLDVIPSLLSLTTLIWPHGSNTWFLGHTPLIHHLCPLLSSCVFCALSQLWHILFNDYLHPISCLLLFFGFFSCVFFPQCSPMRMTQCSHALAVFTVELAEFIVFIVFIVLSHLT